MISSCKGATFQSAKDRWQCALPPPVTGVTSPTVSMDCSRLLQIAARTAACPLEITTDCTDLLQIAADLTANHSE